MSPNTTYKNSLLYKVNTQTIGKASVSIGGATAGVTFLNILLNKEFVHALISGNKIAAAVIAAAFVVVMVSLIGAQLGRNPVVPDDPVSKP